MKSKKEIQEKISEYEIIQTQLCSEMVQLKHSTTDYKLEKIEALLFKIESCVARKTTLEWVLEVNE